MMKKAFWLLLMIGSLFGWAFAITGLVKPFENEKIKKIWKCIFCTWVFGHPLELALSLGIGKKAGSFRFQHSFKNACLRIHMVGSAEAWNHKKINLFWRNPHDNSQRYHDYRLGDIFP